MSEQWHHAPTEPTRPSRDSRGVVVTAVVMGLVVGGFAVATVVLGFTSGRFGGGIEVAVGEPITTTGGLEIVAGPLERADGPSGPQTCSTVTYRNGGDRVASYSSLDWDLEEPGGDTLASTVAVRSDLLGVGDLAPGATASGAVCFPGYEPGRHRLVQESFGVNQPRLVWVGELR